MNKKSELGLYKQKNALITCFILMVYVFLLLLSYFQSTDYVVQGLLSLAAFATLIIMLYRWRKHQAVGLFIVYLLTHSVIFIFYFVFKWDISFYYFYKNPYYLGNVLRMFSVFVITLWLFAKPYKIAEGHTKIQIPSLRVAICQRQSPILFFAALSAMLFIWAFGFAGENIFEAGGYGKIQTTRWFGLKIYEYYLIFFVIAYKYGKNNNMYKFLLFISGFLYIFKNITYGGRIESIQLLLMSYILFYENRLKYRSLVPLAIMAVVFFSIWGNIRGSAGMNIMELVNIVDKKYMFSLSTQGEVTYSSSVMQSLRVDGVYEWDEFLKMFGLFVLSFFIPSKLMPEKTYLTNLAREYSAFGGGGMLSSYFYVWLGVVGVILIGIFVSYLMISTTKKRSEGFTIYLVLVFSTYPRWFSYSPITMFKMCFYGVIVWYIFKKTEEIFSKTIMTYIGDLAPENWSRN